MRKKFLLSVILILVGVTLSSVWAISAMEKKKKEELFKQVEIFSDALAIIQAEYVEEPKQKDLIYGALRGMLASLDSYSQFLDPDTHNELKVETEGKFGGLGVEIAIKDGLLTVVTPLEDTPAWKAGIKAGDRIVKINHELTRQISLTDAVKKLRGPVGEPVNITVFRESEKKILEFKLVRDVIKIRDIKEARILEDGIGYIRLVEFRETTPQDLSLALERLTKEGMNALILDLRNNPGGLLDVAVKVTSKFIEKGKLVVSTKGRNPSQNLEFLSEGTKPLLDLPMVVLINEGSASGSEILAGALQDYQRAIIVGVRSFGKGLVQTVVPLSDGSALRLTTSKYFTPQGKEIHEKGVTPDIVAEALKIAPLESEGEKLEKSQEIFQQLGEKQEAKVAAETFDYQSDSQLLRAVDVLKAIKIYQGLKK
jgi:carboxyl-terminal processing protease